MRTMQFTRRVDDDGVLRLEIPTEDAGDDVEVVVIQPRHTTAYSAWREALRQTWGSCPDLEEPADPPPKPLEEQHGRFCRVPGLMVEDWETEPSGSAFP